MEHLLAGTSADGRELIVTSSDFALLSTLAADLGGDLRLVARSTDASEDAIADGLEDDVAIACSRP
jgi:hypothetical protein